jgi:hypothetical protein
MGKKSEVQSPKLATEQGSSGLVPGGGSGGGQFLPVRVIKNRLARLTLNDLNWPRSRRPLGRTPDRLKAQQRTPRPARGAGASNGEGIGSNSRSEITFIWSSYIRGMITRWVGQWLSNPSGIYSLPGRAEAEESHPCGGEGAPAQPVEEGEE